MRHQLLGTQRNKAGSKTLSLDRNSLPCALPQKQCKALDAKLKWWEFPWTLLYTFMVTTCLWHDTSKPESTLKKKANSVCHHHMREAAAADECRTGHVSTHENPTDIPTKPLPKRDCLASKLLHFFLDWDSHPNRPRLPKLSETQNLANMGYLCEGTDWNWLSVSTTQMLAAEGQTLRLRVLFLATVD